MERASHIGRLPSGVRKPAAKCTTCSPVPLAMFQDRYCSALSDNKNHDGSFPPLLVRKRPFRSRPTRDVYHDAFALKPLGLNGAATRPQIMAPALWTQIMLFGRLRKICVAKCGSVHFEPSHILISNGIGFRT